MLETVSVDPLMVEKTILEVVIVDPVRVEYVADRVVRVLTIILEVLAVAVVCMVLPVNVDTFNTTALRAAKFELRDV